MITQSHFVICMSVVLHDIFVGDTHRRWFRWCFSVAGQINSLYSSNYEFPCRFSNQSVFRLENDWVVQSCKGACSGIFFSRSFIRPYPFKIRQLCIRLTASVQKFSLSVHSFDCIRGKISFIRASVWLRPCENFLHQCICVAVPWRTAWLSVSHPCTCRAFACCACIPKERFPVRGHIYM